MMTPEDVATFSAQAKVRRENLKRAMETAFATMPPPVVVDEPVLLLDASVDDCEYALARSKALFRSEPPKVQRAGCYKYGTMTLSRMSLASLKPEETRCAVAARPVPIAQMGS